MFLLVAQGFSARAEYFSITHYEVDLHITEQAEIAVEETIHVSFTSERHGIFRKLPVRYHGYEVNNPNLARRTVLLGGDFQYSVYDVSSEWPLKQSREGDYLVFRMGHADSYVGGEQTFRLHYKIFGAINFFAEHSELYWNLIGTQWDVPIARVDFRVHLPKPLSLKPEDRFVVTGRFGSRAQDAKSTYDGQILTGQTTQPLGYYEGLTVGLRLPRGYLQNGSLWLNLKIFAVNNLFGLIPLFTLLFAWGIWRRYGKDEKDVVTVRWDPPPITPAEVGLLMNEGANTRHLTTMIYHWGAHRRLRLREVDKPGLIFKGTDYELEKVGELPTDAQLFEAIMFQGLFRDGNVVTISELKNTFYPTLNEAFFSLTSQSKPRFFSSTSTSLMYVGFVLAFFLVSGGLVYGILFQELVSGLYIALSGIITLMFARVMMQKTSLGRQLYTHCMGFKEFLLKVERPRLEAILREDPQYYDKTLAYAIVLGCEHLWSTKFQGLLTEPPQWYVGSYQTFSSDSFSRSLNLSLDSMDSTFVSQPGTAGSGVSGFDSSTSSSGSSSSGFSGGGGGGGGGGSW